MDRFTKQYTALIVEESQHWARMLQLLLFDCGIKKVLIAHSYDEAINILKNERLDVVLCDWTSVDAPGFRVLLAIRDSDLPGDIKLPVVIVSGEPSLLRVTRARDSGANEFLAKPVSKSKLFKILEITLEKSRPFVEADTYLGPDRRRKSRGAQRPRRADDALQRPVIE